MPLPPVCFCLRFRCPCIIRELRKLTDLIPLFLLYGHNMFVYAALCCWHFTALLAAAGCILAAVAATLSQIFLLQPIVMQKRAIFQFISTPILFFFINDFTLWEKRFTQPLKSCWCFAGGFKLAEPKTMCEIAKPA